MTDGQVFELFVLAMVYVFIATYNFAKYLVGTMPTPPNNHPSAPR